MINTMILNERGYTDFVFLIDDILKPRQENGFGIIGWQRPYPDELLRMIQDEDSLIEVLGGDRFRLAQEGINRCKEMYPTMS